MLQDIFDRFLDGSLVLVGVYDDDGEAGAAALYPRLVFIVNFPQRLESHFFLLGTIPLKDPLHYHFRRRPEVYCMQK